MPSWDDPSTWAQSVAGSSDVETNPGRPPTTFGHDATAAAATGVWER